jgi:hypothetical protein
MGLLSILLYQYTCSGSVDDYLHILCHKKSNKLNLPCPAVSSPEAESLIQEYVKNVDEDGYKESKNTPMKNAPHKTKEVRIIKQKHQSVVTILIQKDPRELQSPTTRKGSLDVKEKTKITKISSVKSSSGARSQDADQDSPSLEAPRSKSVVDGVPIKKQTIISKKMQKITNTDVLKNLATPIENVESKARSSLRNLVAVKLSVKDKENVDPGTQIIAQTPLSNSRRRSYKTKSPIAAMVSKKIDAPAKISVTYGGKSKVNSHKEVVKLVGSEHETIKLIDREDRTNRTLTSDILRVPRMRTGTSVLVDIREQSNRTVIKSAFAETPVISLSKVESVETTPTNRDQPNYEERNSVSPQMSEKDSDGLISHDQGSADEYSSPIQEPQPLLTSWRPHVKMNKDENSDIKKQFSPTIMLASTEIVTAVLPNSSHDHGERQNLQNYFRGNSKLPLIPDGESQSNVMEQGSQSQSEAEEHSNKNAFGKSGQEKNRAGKRGRNSGPGSSSDEEGPSSDEDGVIAM